MEILKPVSTEDQFLLEERVIKASGEYAELVVNVQFEKHLNLSDQLVADYLMETYESFKFRRYKLQKEVSKRKAHGVRRPKREIRNIQQEEQKRMLSNVEATLSVLKGEKEGAVRLITKTDLETNRTKITGHMVVDKGSFSS